MLIIFFLFSRLFLSNKVINNLALNNKLSKKPEGSWYYAKCPKKKNCSNIIFSIKNTYNISDISVINNNAFTIYLSSENSKILQQLNLKYLKISKRDKITGNYKNPHKLSNNYIVFLSNSCKIPYNSSKISSNYIMFQSEEPFEEVSQKLSKIGCIRSFERLPQARLNSKKSKKRSHSNNKNKQNQPQETVLPSPTLQLNPTDIFSYYSNFEDETSSEKDSMDPVFNFHTNPTLQNLHRHGINGHNQVVSIVDTGIDSNLCWFVDPEREVERGIETPSDHRKIQGYFSYADFGDILHGGHGSFAAGIIAGSALCNLYANDQCPGTYFNGVAPNSKIVVNDVFAMKKRKQFTLNKQKMLELAGMKTRKDDVVKLLEIDAKKPKDEAKLKGLNEEDTAYKKKLRDERKMRNRMKKRQKMENAVDADNDIDNEIIYFNPYDESIQEDLVAVFPDNLSKLFDLPSKNLGATVQYHGFDFQEKSMFTSLIDTFSYLNPTLLLVFPSGDMADDEPNLYDEMNSLSNVAIKGMTKVTNYRFDKTMLKSCHVSSPGDSKNVLTVGATYEDSKKIMKEFDRPTPILVIKKDSEYVGYCDEFIGISFYEYLINSYQFSLNKTEIGDFNSIFMDKNYSFTVGDQVFVESEKLDAVTFIQSHKFQSTKILIVFKSNELSTKMNKLVIRLPEEYQKEFKEGDKITLKFFDDFNSFHFIQRRHQEKAKYSRFNSRYFRKKPDVYFSGGPVYGPNSGSKTCGFSGVRKDEGTSVSAALATGEILLIQQYIKEGNCVDHSERGMETTNHMIRAILSNIALQDTNEAKSPNLNKFCIFKDSYNMHEIGGIRFFSDFLSSNSHHTYKFKAQFDGILKVTICWNDPPHDPFAPTDVLFKVDCRIQNVKSGNLIGDIHFDPFNTVKNYVLNVKKDEEYKIFVICGDNLFFEKMNYTIVISGPFDHFSPKNEYVSKIEADKNEVGCMQECKDKSKCINGYCSCAKRKYGEDCSKDMIEMHNHKTVKDINLLPKESVFMSYVFKQWKPGSKLSFTFSINSDKKTNNSENSYITKRLFFMFSINSIPRWENANCNSENCQWVTFTYDSLVIEYHLWNFIRNGDTLYLITYSLEDYPISFDVRSTELYT